MARMESNARGNLPTTIFVAEVLEHPERFIHFVVPDDSLFPELRKDDVVVVDTQEGLRDTGIFAVQAVDSEVWIVRLQRQMLGGVKMIRDYPEKDVLELDGEPIVMGRVVMVLRKLTGATCNDH
ncbi:MAG TPA: S24 family peptidase [Geobacteraceae bacterium]